MSTDGQLSRSRRDAGHELAARLEQYRRQAGTIVLALLGAGVIPAAEVCDALELPLEVIIVRKIRAPFSPDIAIGAIAEGGEPFFIREALESTGAEPSFIASEVAFQRAEIARRQAIYRESRALEFPPHGTVILVDDGMATDSTMFAAVRTVREQGAERIVVAIPMGTSETTDRLLGLADEVVVVERSSPLSLVGDSRQRFEEVAAGEVDRVLASHRLFHASGGTDLRQ